MKTAEEWAKNIFDILECWDDRVIRVVKEIQADAQRSVVVPEGWQLVPKEPETEMMNAGKKAFFDMLQNNTFAFATMYQAMLAAAPKPEDV